MIFYCAYGCLSGYGQLKQLALRRALLPFKFCILKVVLDLPKGGRGQRMGSNISGLNRGGGLGLTFPLSELQGGCCDSLHFVPLDGNIGLH